MTRNRLSRENLIGKSVMAPEARNGYRKRAVRDPGPAKLLQFRQSRQAHQKRQKLIESMYPSAVADNTVIGQSETEPTRSPHVGPPSKLQTIEPSMISQDPLSASAISPPTRSTDWRVMRERFGVRPVSLCSRSSLSAGVSPGEVKLTSMQAHVPVALAFELASRQGELPQFTLQRLRRV